MATEQKAYVFFNCDEEKTEKSMNIFYNQTIYKATKKARQELLAKVEAEVAAGRVNITEGKDESVSKAILDGDPTKASNYLQYGTIKSFALI
ncbi:MAG: hypothetical protein K6F95_02330 [Selenomonas sp.]|uniref:hypothetical protein n=1 Tax=Selenomonas sp. TaxID=2053611 RepID=UPI0025EBDADF|nr:hypothetical protein [Selenomonas sp.]MCR5756730.1 hypothetical protein [Selenomonas sp.]